MGYPSRTTEAPVIGEVNMLWRVPAWTCVTLSIALVLCGCVHAPLNRPLAEGPPPADYRLAPRNPATRRDDLFLVVFFSGGGMRAAAFSYGVLKALHETIVPVNGGPRE